MSSLSSKAPFAPPAPYKPRHAKIDYCLTIGSTPRERYLADRFEEMRASLIQPVGRHRARPANWYAYCLALTEVMAVLRGET